MIEVTFLKPGLAPGVKKQVGFASFAAVPLEREGDFACSPQGLLSFSEAKRLAGRLEIDQVVGEVESREGTLEWRVGA